MLTILVAIAFFGFLLWSIQKSQSEENTILSTNTLVQNNTAANNVIKVITPKIDAQIKSPIVVSGIVTLGDNRVRVKIKDSKGLVLAESYATTRVTNSIITFSNTLTYRKPASAKGIIEVFLVANKSGVQSTIVAIPVVFK